MNKLIENQLIDLSNNSYHGNKDYLSNSMLKDFSDDPLKIEWAKSARQNSEKMDAINFGSAFHARLLEQDKFSNDFAVMPDFNLRTNNGKAEKIEFLKLNKSKVILSSIDILKIDDMIQSMLSHPIANHIFNMDYKAEKSLFFKNSLGVKCKIRPDVYIKIDGNNRPDFVKADDDHLIVDIKTIARFDRLQTEILNLKYHWQDYFYSAGISNVFGGKTKFIFIFVSTSYSLGRFPVSIIELDEVAKYQAGNEVESAMTGYREYINNPLMSITEVSLPAWAVND